MPRLRLSLAIALVMGLLAACAAPEPPPAASVFDDENIEKEVILRVNSQHTGKVRVNVTCFNRRVLLTGEVPSETSKSEIAKIVSGVPKVRAVSNELIVGEISGISSRTSDSWVTSDVKFRFLKNSAFPADQIKPTTDNGTVFLMGTVRRKAGASAAELASTTKGVQRVVMVFDYLD